MVFCKSESRRLCHNQHRHLSDVELIMRSDFRSAIGMSEARQWLQWREPKETALIFHLPSAAQVALMTPKNRSTEASDNLIRKRQQGRGREEDKGSQMRHKWRTRHSRMLTVYI